MKAPDYRFTNLIHLDGTERYALVQAFLAARKAIEPDDVLEYGSCHVFVLGCFDPPKIDEAEDGSSYKMTWHDDMLSFEYDYHHGGEILHGKHNCFMAELIRFEKVYKRANQYNRRQETPCQRNNG